MKQIVTIFLIILTSISQGNTTFTICDGYWNDTTIWLNNILPVASDSIYVTNNVRIESDIFLNDNYLEISIGAELCGVYVLHVDTGSKVVVNGKTKIETVDLYDLMIVNGSLYTNLFLVNGLLIINGTIYIGWDGNCTTLSSPCNKPITNFISSDTIICEGECINFYDLSSNLPNNWHWEFPGATTTQSTLQNPQNICYNNEGIYNVMLVASNSLGSDSIISLSYIHVNPTYNYTDSITICSGESILWHGIYYNNQGTFYKNYLTINNCDSIYNLILNVTTIDNLILQTGAMLNANVDSAEYQWISCNTGSPIQGEVLQNFTASENGSYAVIIYQNNCIDTSSCYNITSVGINGFSQTNIYNIYPNPASNELFIEISNVEQQMSNVEGEKGYRVYGVDGKKVLEGKLETPKSHISTKELERGVYFVEVIVGNEKVNGKLVITR